MNKFSEFVNLCLITQPKMQRTKFNFPLIKFKTNIQQLLFKKVKFNEIKVTDLDPRQRQDLGFQKGPSTNSFHTTTEEMSDFEKLLPS